MTEKPAPNLPPESQASINPPRSRQYGRPADRPLLPAGGGVPPVFRMIALFCVILVGVVGWFLMREKDLPLDVYLGPGTGVEAPGIPVRLADETEILSHVGEGVKVFRFAPNRRVLVLDFTSLLEQGLMLNRVAALVEKVGRPRDRVLNDAELDAAILASGDTMETYYLGHDYQAADLSRFFVLADRDGVRLRPQEDWLRQVLRQEGLLGPDTRGALISIPQVGAGHGVDAVIRAGILRHELSHAEFFTSRDYAEYVRRFWRDSLGDEGRSAFKRYLATQGYDPTNEDLMANEMQAYLMHTTDARLFSAASLGVSLEILGRWQADFLLGMPNGWLRDACVATLPSAGAVLRRPRRVHQRGSVSTNIARVSTRRPRRIASVRAA